MHRFCLRIIILLEGKRARRQSKEQNASMVGANSSKMHLVSYNSSAYNEM